MSYICYRCISVRQRLNPEISRPGLGRGLYALPTEPTLDPPIGLDWKRDKICLIITDVQRLLGWDTPSDTINPMHCDQSPLMSLQTASVTPLVPSCPPRSRLTRPSAMLCTHAFSTTPAAFSSPSHLSISAAEKKAAIGFARSFPMISNAAPCTGSKSDGFFLVGSRDAE